jgi:hypothetical protein
MKIIISCKRLRNFIEIDCDCQLICNNYSY